MPRGLITSSLGRAAGHVPGLRRLPVLRLLAAAEIATLARDHFMRLDAQERQRLLKLIRIGRGRRRNLSQAEQDELAALIATIELRALAGQAADKLSPVPLPRRVVYGARGRGGGTPTVQNGVTRTKVDRDAADR